MPVSGVKLAPVLTFTSPRELKRFGTSERGTREKMEKKRVKSLALERCRDERTDGRTANA